MLCAHKPPVYQNGAQISGRFAQTTSGCAQALSDLAQTLQLGLHKLQAGGIIILPEFT